MRLRSAAVIAIALAGVLGPMAVVAQTGILKSLANKPWPAPVWTDEPEVAPVLSPADALKTFTMPPGYHLELVAAEPLIKDPILMEFDADGRLWVMEMPGFAYNEQMENSFEPMNQLVIIEDTNNDGVFDKRTVFMDKLIMPRAFKILDKGCALVGEPPNLWKACDTNGDGQSDTKELVDNTFGTLGIVEHGANGLYWGMDNTLYVSEHTWDVDFDSATGKFSTKPSLRRGQWGVTQDDGGRIYRNVNTDPLFVDYVAPKYYVRNPNLVRTEGLYQNLVDQESTNIWPIHPTFGINRGYRKDIFREDGTSIYYGGVSSPLIYRGQALPKDVQNQPFVVDGPTNIVHLLKLKNENGDLSATDFYQKGEFLASTDVRFRPVVVSGGPDGTLYVLDMYRGVSQDGPLQTDYLRDYHAKRGLIAGLNKGRLYRVVHEGMKTDEKPQMSKETPAQLVGRLSHANGWWRDTAQQLLVQRNDKSVVPALESLARTSPLAVARLHALWTLSGMKSLSPALVTSALGDASPDVRAAALRMSEQWLPTSAPMRAAVVKLIDDPNWFVRRQLAATLGEFPANARLTPIVDVLRKYGNDTITVDAALSGLPNQEGEALALLLRTPGIPSDPIAMLAGAASKGRDPAIVQNLLNLAADARQPTPARIAIMQGVAVGLRTSGGGGGGGGGVVGGRAGGGVPGLVRANTAQGFPISAAPTALQTLVEAKNELSPSATTVLGLLSWPGKPAAPAVAALSADDQKRFDAGRKIYDESCAACHQADGTGIERVGAPLKASKWVTGASDPLIRILTNGKEGAFGVMPPLGAGLSDDDLASVLTYIRRAFGNTAPPVVPAEVKETRQAYSHRDMPWTEAELEIRRR
jgi:mono/diheme cytochrome c family protein